MSCLWNYVKDLAGEWKKVGTAAIFGLSVLLGSVPAVENLGIKNYIQPTSLAGSTLCLGWAVLSVYNRQCQELERLRSKLDDVMTYRLIRLRKALGEIAHNFEQFRVAKEPSGLRDELWTDIGDAVILVPQELLDRVQAFYVEIRSLRNKWPQMTQAFAKNSAFTAARTHVEAMFPKLLEDFKAVAYPNES